MTTTPRAKVSRALRLSVAVAALATIASWSATADAKKAHKLKMDPTVEAAPEPKGPVPPEADSNGHVHFGNPQAEGLGRVTVKSAKGDQIQVYLEGRYFGDAPITIYSVPKGDYIVEGTLVSNGKQVAKPVSVSENEEATVELADTKPETPAEAAPKSGFLSGEISPTRKKVTYGLVATAAVGLVVAGVFGWMEHTEEQNYEKTPSTETKTLGEISDRGKRDALVADLGLFLLGGGIVGAVIAGYPMLKKPNPENASPEAVPPTAYLAPMIGGGATGGTFVMRF